MNLENFIFRLMSAPLFPCMDIFSWPGRLPALGMFILVERWCPRGWAEWSPLLLLPLSFSLFVRFKWILIFHSKLGEWKLRLYLIFFKKNPQLFIWEKKCFFFCSKLTTLEIPDGTGGGQRLCLLLKTRYNHVVKDDMNMKTCKGSKHSLNHAIS